MKINDAKSAVFFKKCLAAIEFKSYAELCKIMEDFNRLSLDEQKKVSIINNASSNFGQYQTNNSTTSNRINTLLEKYLPLAAEGDLSFLSTPEVKKVLDSFPDSNIPYEVEENFKKYAAYSRMHSDFKHADQKFSTCLRKKEDGTMQFSKQSFKKFEASISSPAVSKFYDRFQRHSHRYLGYEHYKISKDSLGTIAALQPESDLAKTSSKITPESYDANIRGFYRPALHKQNVDRLSGFEYQKPSDLSESIYARTLGKRHEIKQGMSKRIIAILMAVSLGVIGINQYINSYLKEFNETTIENADNLQISLKTKEAIEQTRKMIDDLRNSNEFPEIATLNNIRNSLDDNMDLIFDNLITNAIKEETGLNVYDVETHYDLSREANPYYITCKYKNKDGIEKTKTIDNLQDENGLVAFFNRNISIRNTFDNEIKLDREYTTFLNNFKNAKDVNEKAKALSELLDFFEGIQKDEEIVGGKKIDYSKGNFFTGGDSITLVNTSDDSR